MNNIIIIILKGDTKLCDNNIEKIKYYFTDPCFIVHVIDIECDNDTLKFKTALLYIKENYKDNYCVIIKDNSIICTDNMTLYLNKCIKHVKNADLIFLCKWMDQCYKYTGINGMNYLKWTPSSNAAQAIMFSPNGRNIIYAKLKKNITIENCLQINIEDNTLSAAVFSPNIVNFDINLAKSNEDYYKLNECEIIKNINTQTSNINTMIWLILLILLVIFLVIIVPYFKYYHNK